MSNNELFDLVAIGAGTGATGVASTCAKAGWRVAIVDALPFGGTCALRGCDPKKILVGVTEALDWSRRVSGKGLRVEELTIDWAELMAFKRSYTDGMPERVEQGLARAGVVLLHGTAKFVAPGVLRVGDQELRAKHFHIATGARPATLNIPGEGHLTSSTQFLELGELPSRVAFVGGGYIAFEFAHIARRSGAAQVAILDQGSRALPGFDPDLVDLQVGRTRELGIDVRLESRVAGIERDGDTLRVGFVTPRGSETIVCDLVVHAAGRVPNLEALQLDAIGVEVGPRGVRVEKSMRSISNPTVFAVGDCADTGAPKLTPVAAYQARIAAKNLLAGEDARHVDYPPIPSVLFTVPPLARVGLLEEEAREQKIEFDVHFQKTGPWYSSLRVAESHSAFKVLVEKVTGKIIAAHVMGAGAEEQINVFTMAMNAGLTANQLKAVIFAYPSYATDVAFMV